MQAVTHARASYDNHGSVLENMAPLFASSLFFQAINLKPSKDNVQTRLNGRGGSHRDAALEAAVATLSCGPVGIGDGLASFLGSGSNVSLVLATCNTNGSLLQPSRPASGIDAMFTRGWNPELLALPPSGFISVTHTHAASAAAEHSSSAMVSGGANVSSWLVLAIAVGTEFQLSPAQLFPRPPPGAAAPAFWVSQWTDSAKCVNGSDAVSTGCLRLWESSDRDLPVHTGAPSQANHKNKEGFYYPWELTTLCKDLDACSGRCNPSSPNHHLLGTVRRLTRSRNCVALLSHADPRAGRSQKWVLLGEMSKFVRLSPGRVRSMDDLDGAGLRVCVYGAQGERVLLSALAPGSTVVHTLALLVGGDLWEERGAGQGGWVQCGTFAAGSSQSVAQEGAT
jgi:hypothetical protein